MSKAMLVTWPFVMLLLDYWPLAECRMNAESFSQPHASRPRNTQHAPLAAGAGEGSLFCFERDLLHPDVLDGTREARSGWLRAAPALLRLENAVVAYAGYLGKTFWPAKLAMPYVRPGHWSWLEVGGSVLVVVGVCLVVLWLGRRRPYMLVGWCWFLGTLIPVIGLTKGWGSFMADRFTYVPSIGVLMFTVWGVCELTRGWWGQVVMLSVAGGVAIVLCLALTWQQTGYWRDSEALFRHAVEVTENNDLAHNNLGNVPRQARSKPTRQSANIQEAAPPQTGQRPRPHQPRRVLGKKGQTDEAIRQYQEAHPLETGLRRGPQQPRRCPRQERPNRRGHRPISGS